MHVRVCVCACTCVCECACVGLFMQVCFVRVSCVFLAMLYLVPPPVPIYALLPYDMRIPAMCAVMQAMLPAPACVPSAVHHIIAELSALQEQNMKAVVYCI